MKYSRLIKHIILNIILMFSIHASDFPDGVIGVADFDFFKERLPSGSKGIYQIFSLHKGVRYMKYLGSAREVNSRLECHRNKKVLVPGDEVRAILFRASTRQKVILEYEKELIKIYSPPLNKHPGAPGRPWQCEQISKLDFFLKHNEPFLTPEGKVLIQKILSGKENVKLRRSLLRIMRVFK